MAWYHVIGVALLGIIVIQNASHHETKFLELPERPELKGPLSPNRDLQNAKILLKGEVHGPESLVWLNGALYSTVEDGFVKIVNDKIVQKFKTAKNDCSYPKECGRPLGIRHYKDEKFIVADCYKGILEVDFKTEKVTTLLSENTIVDGIKLNFANDLDFIDEETIIFSDASTTHKFLNIMLEPRGDGRIIKFNLNTKEVSAVVKNLRLANGVQTHSDKQSILVAEIGAARVVRYYFAGPKKGSQEYFITNLPGLPDNIRATNRGTYYIACAIPRIANYWSLIDTLAPYPSIRKLILQLVPESHGFTLYIATMADYGIFVEVDSDGKIMKSWQDPTGFTKMISQIIDADDAMYVGSYAHDHLAKIVKTVK